MQYIIENLSVLDNNWSCSFYTTFCFKFYKEKAFVAERRVVCLSSQLMLTCPVNLLLVSFSEVTIPSIVPSRSVQVSPLHLLHGSHFKSHQMPVVTSWEAILHNTSPCSSVDFLFVIISWLQEKITMEKKWACGEMLVTTCHAGSSYTEQFTAASTYL